MEGKVLLKIASFSMEFASSRSVKKGNPHAFCFIPQVAVLHRLSVMQLEGLLKGFFAFFNFVKSDRIHSQILGPLS